MCGFHWFWDRAISDYLGVSTEYGDWCAKQAEKGLKHWTGRDLADALTELLKSNE